MQRKRNRTTRITPSLGAALFFSLLVIGYLTQASHAGELATDVAKENFSRWGKPGIRAQLYDMKNRRLEMDFRFEGDARSFHVLNAVSPAFTCAQPFTHYLFDEIESRSAKRSSVGEGNH